MDFVLKIFYIDSLLSTTVLLLKQSDVLAVELHVSLLELLLVSLLLGYLSLGGLCLSFDLFLPVPQLLDLLDSRDEFLLHICDSLNALLSHDCYLPLLDVVRFELSKRLADCDSR